MFLYMVGAFVSFCDILVLLIRTQQEKARTEGFDDWTESAAIFTSSARKEETKVGPLCAHLCFLHLGKNGPRCLQRESETKKTLRRGDSVGLTPMPQISAFMGIDRSVVGEYSFNYQLSMNVRLLVPIILRRHTHLIRYYWKSLPLIKFQCCSLFLLLHSCYYISNSMGLESTFIPFQGNQSCPNFTSQIKNHALILIGSSC